MERADDHLFNEIISACEDKKNKALMGFKKNWNKELIAQFYATMYFGSIEGDRAMFWMTEGKYYKVKFNQFVWYSSLTSMMSISQRYIIKILY
jgi:hypothetical protein